MDKVQLRKLYLNRRQEFKKRKRAFEESSLKIARHIHQFLSDIPQGSLVFGYRAFGSEAPLPWVEGFRWSFPRLLSDSEMSFHEISHVDGLHQKNLFGISEPKEEAHTLRDAREAKVILVPGVAFDLQGHRLGMGKGFYDRFLAPITGALKVGIGFEMQLHDQLLPVSSWDHPMDWLITDRRTIGFSRRK